MLNGEGSLTLDTVSIARASENMKLALADEFQLAKVPAGPARRLGPPFSYFNYLIWSFAENIDGAKQFLVDYVGQSREAFLASRLQNTPAFPDTVPDLATIVSTDAGAGHQANTIYWRMSPLGRPMSEIRATPMRRSAKSSMRG